MPLIPDARAIYTDETPTILRDMEHADEHDIVRFIYDAEDASADCKPTIVMVFRHRATGVRRGLKFRSVLLSSLFPITGLDDTQLVIQFSPAGHGEGAGHRCLEIRDRVIDGLSEVMFWAGSVETLAD